MASQYEEHLATVRDQIDRLDREVLERFSQRARLAQEVAKIKEDGEGNEDYYRPEREAQVLRALLQENPGPLADAEVAHLFQELMSACRALENAMAVAFLGPRGTYTEVAALKHFGRAVQVTPLESIDAVFREVEAGGCEYGVVPVENSTEGMVSHTLDMFVRSQLQICGEVNIPIHHHLLGKGGELNDLRRIYSHQQSFAQCRRWLDGHLPQVEKVALSSNGEAARRAAMEPETGAIAGETAASAYGLQTIAENVEDEPDNTTRFLVVGKRSVPASGVDKTSLLISAKNQPGTLFRLLKPFAQRNISMTRIESRPARRGRWEYVFFVDVDGHVEDPEVRAALEELEDTAGMVRVLGAYPKASW